ncbi:MAG: hypothetical protein ABSC30_14890 [Acidimicrobiales bacterium]
MAEITVTAGPWRGGDATFQVEVRDGAITTSHTVTLPPRLAADLGWTDERAVELIEASFEFLLEREPATSVLRRFRLDVIGDYFPDYADEMARRARTRA